MVESVWRRRVDRAQELTGRYPFAAEILTFYVTIAQFQESLYKRLESAAGEKSEKERSVRAAGPPELSELITSFPAFLSLVRKNGPSSLAQAAGELQSTPERAQANLLNSFWDPQPDTAAPLPSHEFFGRTFLQPYAEFLRSRALMNWDGYTGSLCPFCNRKAGMAVLRPQGDGGQRSLICSFCVAEWVFRRIVCPACGEEDHRQLPVYTAEQFEYIRVECCDRCKHYIKTVDLTKTGLAEPLIDELASVPLDLWAREHGYQKLELNLMQL